MNHAEQIRYKNIHLSLVLYGCEEGFLRPKKINLRVFNNRGPVGCLELREGGEEHNGRMNKTMECGILHFVDFANYYESN